MKLNRAWMILLGLPALALGQGAAPGGPGPVSREPANAPRGSAVREQTGMPGSVLTPLPQDAVKAITRVPIPPEEMGLAWGPFQWYPDVQLGLTYDTNLFATRSDTVDDWMWTITPSLVGRSESDRFEVNVRVGASAQRYKDNFRQNADEAWADLQGTVHLSGATDLFGGVSWTVGHEDRGSPNLLFGIEPTVYTDTSLHGGAYHDFGRHYVRIGLAGTRLDFDPVPTATPGVMLDSDARDRDVASVGGRWGWRATPSTDVFVQGVVEHRDYVRATDVSGYARSSKGYRVDAGVAVDVDRHLVGEAYAGVLRQNFKDPRFDDMEALDVGADLRWHTSPWTMYRLGLERTLDETVVAGSPANMSTTVSARVEHDISSLSLFTGGVSLTRDRFRQIARADDQVSLHAGLRHYVTDGVYLGADYRYMHRASNVLEANYDRSLVMVTLGTDFGARRRNRYFAYQGRTDAEWPTKAFDFSGLYVGLQAGASVLQTDASGLRDQQPGNTDAGELAHFGSQQALFAGFGKQWGRWYAGVDFSAETSTNRLSHDHPNATEPLVYTVNEESGWSAGLRLGSVLAGSSLLYGRMGWAETTFGNTMLNLDGSYPFAQRQQGWQLGMGAETQLSSSMFWRFDYTVTRYDDYHLITPSYDERYRNRTAAFSVGLGWRLGKSGGAPEVGIEPKYLDGVYGGVQAGHGALATDWTVSQHYHASGSDSLKADFGAMGATAGGFLGFGHTWGRWYGGVEAEADGAHMKWTHERVTSGSGGRDFSVEKKWSYSAALRGGYVLDNGALLYGRVGVAKSLFNTRYARGSSGLLDRDDTLMGNRWGVGLEVPVDRVTYWRLDYVTTDYDGVPSFSSLGSNPDVASWNAQERIFRFGFGVRF